MMTSVHTPDEVVKQYMMLMQEGAEKIAKAFYRAGFITHKTVRLGISMPLHPAAKQYYDEFQQQLEQAPENKKESVNEIETE